MQLYELWNITILYIYIHICMHITHTHTHLYIYMYIKGRDGFEVVKKAGRGKKRPSISPRKCAPHLRDDDPQQRWHTVLDEAVNCHSLLFL